MFSKKLVSFCILLFMWSILEVLLDYFTTVIKSRSLQPFFWRPHLHLLLLVLFLIRVNVLSWYIFIALYVFIAGSQGHMLPECPANVQWSNDGLERDLYIQTETITVLAMDGRRRWLDIQKLVSLTVVYLQFASSSLNYHMNKNLGR